MIAVAASLPGISLLLLLLVLLLVVLLPILQLFASLGFVFGLFRMFLFVAADVADAVDVDVDVTVATFVVAATESDLVEQ